MRKKQQIISKFAAEIRKFNENTDEIPDEIAENTENINEFINPFYEGNSLENLHVFLIIRQETQRRSWELNSRIYNRIIYGKMKKNEKFSMLIIDDNISDYKEYQKLSYNSSIMIDFSDNFKKGREIFKQTIDHGKCYDMIMIDIAEKAEESKKFIEEIREIEKELILENVRIFGVLNKKGKEEEFYAAGIDELFYERIGEGLLKEMIGKVPRGRELVWK